MNCSRDYPRGITLLFSGEYSNCDIATHETPNSVMPLFLRL